MISNYIIFFMSSLSTQIAYYLRIAIDINKKIGGKRGYQAEAEGKDKFSIQKDNVNKDMHWVKAKLLERQKKTGAEVLGINMEIKDKLESIFNQIQRMKQAINSEKNSNENAKNIKYQIVEQLREKAKRLEQMVEGPGDIKNLTGAAGKNNQTLTSARALLLDTEGRDKNTYRVNTKKKKQADPSQIELQAMDRWKKTDAAIDDRLDDLTQRTIQWKKKVKQTGELIDQSDKKIDDLTTQVDKVNDNLLRSNKQLKGIIEQYRKPHKFCIDIVLILLLVGLLVGIIKVSRS